MVIDSFNPTSVTESGYTLQNSQYRGKIRARLKHKRGFKPTFLGGLNKLKLSTAYNGDKNKKQTFSSFASKRSVGGMKANQNHSMTQNYAGKPFDIKI